jgi:hypothetical protein
VSEGDMSLQQQQQQQQQNQTPQVPILLIKEGTSEIKGDRAQKITLLLQKL